MRTHGVENFKLVMMEEGLSVEFAKLREQYYIASRNTKYPNGYNLTDGGDGNRGWKMSDTQREIARDNQLKNWQSPEYAAFMKQAMTGRTWSEAARRKMSEYRTGTKRNEEAKANISAGVKASWHKAGPCRVEKHTEETKKQMSESQKKMWAERKAKKKSLASS